MGDFIKPVLIQLLQFLLLLFIFTSISNARVLTVNSTSDAGSGTLRETIQNSVEGDTIIFSPTTNNNPIQLTTGELLIDHNLFIIGNGPMQTIISGSNSQRVFNAFNCELWIEGLQLTNGLSTSGGGAMVTTSVDLTIQNSSFHRNHSDIQAGALLCYNGTTTIINSIFNENLVQGTFSEYGGGAIANIGSIFNIQQCSFTANEVLNSGLGGAILNDSTASLTIGDCMFTTNNATQVAGALADVSDLTHTTTISNSSFENNFTSGINSASGAILLGSGEMVLQNCQFSGNSSGVQGGAIWIGTGSLSIDNSVLTNNSSGNAGGAIYNHMGMLTIENNSLLSNNTCTNEQSRGGAIFTELNSRLVVENVTFLSNAALQSGGAIADVSDLTLSSSITNSSFEENTASGSESAGGAVLLGKGELTLINCNLLDNSSNIEGGAIWMDSGSLSIDNSVLTNNSSGNAGGAIYNSKGSLTITNNTLFDGNSCMHDQSQGGALFTDLNTQFSIENANFSNNSTVQAGGAIADISNGLDRSVITKTNFENNSASGINSAGGALLLSHSSILMQDCAFIENIASVQGGAIWIGNGQLTCANTFFKSNLCEGSENSAGGGLFQSGGKLFLIDGTILRNNKVAGGQSLGGGIYSENAIEFKLTNVEVSTNTASFGGGIFVLLDTAEFQWEDLLINGNIASSIYGLGGGLALYGLGKITISDSHIKKNKTQYYGGGIFNEIDSLNILSTLIDSNIIDSNQVENRGGAIAHSKGHILIEGSTLSFNKVKGDQSGGGAIFMVDSSSCRIIRSTISNNLSENAGGGILSSGTLEISATTIAKNEAYNAGGGIYQFLTDTISNETHTYLNSTLLADNRTNGTGEDLYSLSIPIRSNDYNLIHNDDMNVFAAKSTDLVGSATNQLIAHIMPLQYNGGSTPTHAIDCSSPAVNSGDPALDIPDQRGKDVSEQIRDIGAFEFQDSCATTDITIAQKKLRGVKIFPNPNISGTLSIKIPSSLGSNIEIEIKQLSTGLDVYKSAHNTRKVTINVSSLPAGTYLLIIQSEDQFGYRKFQVVK